MRLPISWLREFVQVPSDVTHEQIHAALVKVGFEEEDVHAFGLTGPIVVGRVVEFVDEPQSNGKTIRWCQVDVGPAVPEALEGTHVLGADASTSSATAGRDIRGIVCGASNFAVGDKVVVTLPGAILPGPFPIAARKTYGHVSDGMIASAKELGLGEDHAGIIVLSALGLDPEPGTDAIELLGLDDFAVEINVTPDRGYAFSIRGLAREYSHATGAAFHDPAEAPLLRESAARPASGFEVAVDDQAPIRGRVGCTVFVTRVVRGVDGSRPTPPWMVARLALAGIRSISLIVDITNYVMLELGQPTHAYDLHKLTGGIVVRRASEGETITTLDDKVRTLSTEDLLITDGSGPIGLAGVMGGATTEIGEGSSDVLIEAANFDPISIARSARRHKLPSEASRRFERGVDPRVAAPAAARVAQLLVELGGGTSDSLGSVLDESAAPEPIVLPEGYIARIVGVEYSRDEIVGSLEMIGAVVEPTDSGVLVTPPSWRPDLTDKATLAEEVARVVGYDRIPSVLPVAPPGRGLSREQRLRRLTSNLLAGAGLTEVLAYPFVSEAQNDLFGSADGGAVPAVRLVNALDPDAAWLRTSLLPGLLQTAHRNLARGLTDLALFEAGKVFLPETGRSYGSGPLPAGNAHPEAGALQALHDSIPPQPWHVAAVFLGDASPKQPGHPAAPHGLGHALGAVARLGAAIAVDIRPTQGTHQALHPGRTAQLRVGERLVGWAGELLPALAHELDLPRVVSVFELDLDALIELAAQDLQARPIRSMPAATQDVSLVVDAGVTAAELHALIVEGAGDLLEHARLVDDYRGAGISEGQKSLTFALRFRASDRTLTAAEATEAKLAAVALAASRVGATVRE